jgi:hypothetical protein
MGIEITTRVGIGMEIEVGMEIETEKEAETAIETTGGTDLGEETGGDPKYTCIFACPTCPSLSCLR